METVNVVAGFGSDRYLETAGSGKVWRLDQTQTEECEPLVTVGHDEPIPMRPLSRDVVERMRNVIVESSNE